MKRKIEPKHISAGIVAFSVIVASILLLFILWRFEVIASVIGTLFAAFTPVLMGLVIAYLLLPVMRFFDKLYYPGIAKQIEKKTKAQKVTRALAVVTAMLIALAVIAGLLWLLLPQLIDSISSLIVALPGYFTNLRDTLMELLANQPDLQQQISEFFNEFQDTVIGFLSDIVLPQMGDWVSNLTNGIMGFFTGLLNLVVGFILAIYVLYHKDLYSAQAKKILFACFKSDHANGILRVTRLAHHTFGGFISGQIINAVIVGVICFILMAIFQMPYALLVSVIMTIFNVIPYFGPFIGAIPSALLILMVDPWDCLWFIIMILVLQQIDGTVISPRILGDSIGLSGFWVMVSILVMNNLIGFVGMVIGVPVFAVLYVLIKERVGRQLRKRKLDPDTIEYMDLEYLHQTESGEVCTTQLSDDEFEKRHKKEEHPSRWVRIFSRKKKK